MSIWNFFKKPQPNIRKEWCCPTTEMEFVWVPGGVFKRGNNHYSVPPVHKIKVDDFWLGKYLVTQGDWIKLMGDNPSSFKKGDRYPVECVSWYDVQEFIGKLNENEEGTFFRLPTEAEWEYACRSRGKEEDSAGCRVKGFSDLMNADVELGKIHSNMMKNHNFSKEARYKDEALTKRRDQLDSSVKTDDTVNRIAWYKENSGNSTHPVGEKIPNGLGLYDMSGNVSEWVQDWYGDYSISDTDNPTGPNSGKYRVARGGDYDADSIWVSSGKRGNQDPEKRYSNYGFRLFAHRK